MADESAASRLGDMIAREVPETSVLSGTSGLVHVAMHPDVDYVMAAIVGGAGLMPTLAAARSGKRVLLANKEALVMSGRLFMDACARGRGGAPADRQRAQRDIPVYVGRATETRGATRAATRGGVECAVSC